MQNSLRTLFPRSIRTPAALAALATMIAVPPLQAAVLKWDIAPGTIGAGNGSVTGGAGTWNTVASLGNWTVDEGVTNVAWVNNPTADSAIFGGTGGTVTLATGIRVDSIAFETSGYSIAGDTLTLAGPAPTITAGENATIGSIIAGSDGLTKAGFGTLTLSGTNTYTNGTLVTAGVLQISADANLGSTAASNPITLNGGTLSTGTSNLTLNANHPLNVGPAGGTLNGTVANVINFNNLGADKLIGGGKLTITGTGSTNSVLQIAGAQKLFSGDINIESARINLSASTATLGTGKVTIGGGSASLYASATVNLANQFTIRSSGGENRGAIRLSGGGTLSGPIILEGDASIHSDAGGTSTTNLSGNISGDFVLGIGNGTAGNANNRYVLTGTNTHAATVFLGILNVNSDAALGAASGMLTMNNNATLQAGAPTLTLNAAREVVLNGIAKFDPNGGSISIAGPITGFGSLEKTRPGTLTLSGANSYTGSTKLAAGTLTLEYSAQDSSKLDDFADLMLSGGTLRLVGGTHPEVVGQTLIEGANTILSQGAAPINLGTLTRSPGGSLALSAGGIATSNATNLPTGILGAWATVGGKDWAMASPTGLIVAYTGYTNVPFGGAIANAPTANIRLTGGTTGNVTLGAAVTNINTLLQNQTTATIIETATNTLRLAETGGILVPEGTGALTIGATPNSGKLTAGGIDNQPGEISITTNSANLVTVNSVIADNGLGQVALAKSGTGTLVLTGTNTFTGSIAIAQGTLEIGGTGSLGATYNGTVSTNGSFVHSSAANAVLTGIISGTGNIIKSGTGALTLSGDNSYAGGTALSSGTLNVNSATALGTGALTVTGGSLDNSSGTALTVTRNNAQNWNGDFSFIGTNDLNLGTGAVVMNGSRALDVKAGTLTVGSISGVGFSLTKVGSGTLSISGSGTYTGGTNVNGGTLQVSTPAGLSNAAPVAIAENATVSLVSNLSNTYSNVFTGGGRILLNTIGANGDTRLSGVSTGFNGTLQLAGSGGNKLNAQGLQIGATALIKIDSGGQLFTAGTSLANPIEVIGTGNTENRGAIRLNGASVLSGPITLLGNTTIGGESASITGTVRGTAAAAETQTLTLGTTNSANGGTYNGAISDGSGGGKLALVIFSGTNNLGGINTYSGATSVSGTATLNLTGSSANSALTMGAGTSLRGEGTVASINTSGALNLTVDPSTPGAFTSAGAAALGGTVNVALSGAAIPLTPVTLLNFDSTTATAGTFALANSANYRAPLFTVGAKSATLALGNTSLTWTGSGGSEWNVNGTSNWKDGTAAPQKFFFGDVVTFNDDLATDQMITLAAAVQPGAILVDNSEIAYTLASSGTNVITAGSLTKRGTDVLTLTGAANTFSGGTLIEQGAINVQHNGSLGTGTVTVAEGGTLIAGANNLTLANPIVLGGGKIDTSERVVTNTLNLNGVVSGTGDITLISNGDTSATGGGQVGLGVRFGNTANTFTGDITVTSGLFSYQSDGSLGNPANKVILNGGGLLDNGTGVNLTHDVEVLENGGLFRTYSSTVATLTGALTGSGEFRHTDGGRLILAGDLSGFTGVYDNQSGTTVITGAAPSGGSWMISGGTLTYQAAGAQSWDKPVSGAGALNVASGTLELKGDNQAFSGPVNVTGGNLLLTGGIEGSFVVNVNSGKLRLGAANRISDSAILTLGGGILETAGFSDSVFALNVTASSTLDFGSGASLLSFSGFGSNLETNAILTIQNWSGSLTGGGTDQLLFGEDMSQWISQFTFAGIGPATQILHGDGVYEIVAVPEPSSLALLGAALGLAGLRRSRRRS